VAQVGTFKFSAADVARFSAASFDRNPLHISDDYARRTVYGERVVFGILGLLTAYAHTPPRPEQQLKKLTADFQNPLFLNVEYTVDVVEDSQKRRRLTVLDGRELVMSCTAEFAPGPPSRTRQPAHSPEQTQPAQHTSATIATASAAGAYYPAETYAQPDRGLSDLHAASLLWSSYLIGMQLPGERALFSRLQLTFIEPPPPPGPLAYRASVASFDDRFNLARIHAQLAVGDQPFATAELRAFVRDDVPRRDLTSLRSLLPPSKALRGKVALVTGGSRGLGAAIVRALASQGCHVYASYLRSRDEVERLAREMADQAGGTIVGVQGDAADLDWCTRTLRRITEECGGLDILVCNAAPPLRPMALHANVAARLSAYVGQTVALTSTPLATCLDQLADRRGWCVVISSAAVDELVAEWPHYVSAKAAVEALAQIAARQQPSVSFLTVRPPRLLTDLTNTASPLSRQDTLTPEPIAAAIVKRLSADAAPGAVELLNQFAQPERDRN
jgi:NAD(P)-dependent dehydrogenase (short-subunit alcohol dehydrogenase family)